MDLMSNVKVLFDLNQFKWRYDPVIKITLKEKPPTLPSENPQQFKPLIFELPFLHNEKHTVFFYMHENQLYGFFNLCTHIKVPLDYEDQRFFNILGNIVCKVHGAQFCPFTGKVLSGPARSPLYKVDFTTKSEGSSFEIIIHGFYF